MQDSSSGSSEGKFKLQLEAKACAMVDDTQPDGQSGDDKTPVMVGITVLSGTTDKRAPPLDLVVVLHILKGCNVPKNWEKLLTEAIHVVVDNLDDNDRLAILPVQSTLTTIQQASAAADMSLRNLPQGIVSNRSLLEALETAESILYRRQHEDNKNIRAGYIIVISNSNDDIDSLLPWRFPSVHAFGFRDAHNARTMHTISGSRNCTYAVLDDEHGRLTQAFLVSINRITSSVTAMPLVEVKLNCDQKVVLSAIDTPGIRYIISHDKKLGLVWPSAHLAGVPTNFIVNLGGLQHHDNLAKLFKAHVKYSNVPDKEIDVQVVRKGDDGSKEVVAELLRIKIVRTVTDIIPTDENDWEKLHAATHYLHRLWTELVECFPDCGREAGKHGMISSVSADMQEMEIRLYNNYFWLEHMLTWQSHQRCQLPLPEQFMDNRSSNDPILRLRIFAKADLVPAAIEERQKRLPVLLSVMAPEGGLAKVKRASIDLIVVLDASYGAKEMEQKAETRMKLVLRAKQIQEELLSNARRETRKSPEMAIEMKKLWDQAKEMEEDLRNVKGDTLKRLQLLTKAMELVTKKLSVRDRLAIIPVQSSAVTAPTHDLLEISKQGRSEVSTKVQSVVDHVVKRMLTAWSDDEEATQVLPDKRPRCCKTSHWKEQSQKVTKLFKNCFHITPNLSTHSTTSAESQDTASNMRKALMDAVKILDDRHGENRQGFIIVISDSDDDSICEETLSPNHITHAFGFYDRHNTRAMYHIASSSNGIYDTLNNGRNKITEAFTACINKITSTISIGTKVKIKCCHSSNVALSTIESGQFRYSVSSDRKSSSIFFGSLSAGMVKNFIVYVDNVRCDDYDNFSKLFTVHVKWLHALNRVEEKLEGQVVVVRDDVDDGFKEIEENITRGDAIKIASEITDRNYYKKMIMEDKLQQMCLKCLDCAQSAGDDNLARLIISIRRMLLKEEVEAEHDMQSSPNDFKNKMAEELLSYMLSWLSYQGSSEQGPSLPSAA